MTSKQITSIRDGVGFHAEAVPDLKGLYEAVAETRVGRQTEEPAGIRARH